VQDDKMQEKAAAENEAEKQNEPSVKDVQPNYMEQLQYLQAEFLNYKRRIEKQKYEWQDDALRNLLSQLLPVIDDLELYLQHHPVDDMQKSESGIKMIYDKLMAILINIGLEKVSTEILFDPEKHEAVFVEQKDDVPHGHILQVWQPGYYFKEKLLRPARVKVAEKAVERKNES
jgi:molecular chaperone GrpE